jgi:hypothetical protein
MIDHLEVELWRDEFRQTFYNYTNSQPIILPGTRPVVDVKVLKISDYDSVWFWYPLNNYSPNYWYRFFNYCDENSITMYISTANQISETIGIPVWDRNIPSIWIMCLEKI